MTATKILHLLGTAEVEGTGIAKIVASLSSCLDASKYELHAWFLGKPGPLADDLDEAGVITKSVHWSRGARDLSGAFRFWRRLRNEKFSIVHQHFGARSPQIILKLFFDCPLVVHLHGMPSSPRGATLPELWFSNHVIAASHAIASEVTSESLTVVYAGLHAKTSTFASKRSASDLVIGAVSRLTPEKGLVTLLRAISSLAPEFPMISLELVGDGPSRSLLESETVRLGLAGKVRFIGWKRDLDTWFSRWSIFAHPSLNEGFGLSVLEAMLQGLPVVASRAGGLPELILEGVTGSLVAPADSDALASALRAQIIDRELRLAMGDAGRARALKIFRPERMATEIEAIYDALIQRKRQY